MHQCKQSHLCLHSTSLAHIIFLSEEWGLRLFVNLNLLMIPPGCLDDRNPTKKKCIFQNLFLLQMYSLHLYEGKLRLLSWLFPYLVYLSAGIPGGTTNIQTYWTSVCAAQMRCPFLWVELWFFTISGFGEAKIHMSYVIWRETVPDSTCGVT